MRVKCQLRKGPLRQCCCRCVHLHPVHHHCTTSVALREKLTARRGRLVCVCGIRKGWACVPPGFDGRVYDNWARHSVGCELYEPRERNAKGTKT
jgi:hypothetical protein